MYRSIYDIQLSSYTSDAVGTTDINIEFWEQITYQISIRLRSL